MNNQRLKEYFGIDKKLSKTELEELKNLRIYCYKHNINGEYING